jgi:ubiquinone/menaquinone biosynthesis C-methylase UbiE
MAHIDFISAVHKKTNRDYIGRVNEFPKAEAAAIAKRFDRDYWDGDRRVGYGGMNYDGRWRVVAEAMSEHYKLRVGDRVLDVGCGKGFLLFELMQVVPGIVVSGLDVSTYAVENAKPEVQPFLQIGCASKLPFPENSFDLVKSVNTLHNLYCFELDAALREIERVGRRNKFICMESYRNEVEKTNLLYWQLTCESLCTPEEWQWWFRQTGYTGDRCFIFFE